MGRCMFVAMLLLLSPVFAFSKKSFERSPVKNDGHTILVRSGRAYKSRRMCVNQKSCYSWCIKHKKLFIVGPTGDGLANCKQQKCSYKNCKLSVEKPNDDDASGGA